MSTQIRTMVVEDCNSVIELWKSIEGVVLTDTDDPLSLQMYFERNPGMSHVAIRGGELIGAALCGHDGRRGYLHHLAVAPAFRTQGIGRSLVDASLSALLAAGIKCCNLFIMDGNQDAREFWQNDGWKEWPEIRLMQRELASYES